MKKIFIVFGVVFLICLSACSKEETKNVLDDLISHSNFEYQLNSSVTAEMKSEFLEFSGFGMYTLVDPSIDLFEDDINEYMSENPTTYYDVSGYPNCRDEYVITRIYTSDPSLNVYGYAVGDIYENESVILFMDTIGFDKIDESQFLFENGDVRIRLYYDLDNIIYQIGVELVSSCNVIF